MLNTGNLKFISPCISAKPTMFKNITILQGPLFSVKMHAICQACSLGCECIQLREVHKLHTTQL